MLSSTPRKTIFTTYRKIDSEGDERSRLDVPSSLYTVVQSTTFRSTLSMRQTDDTYKNRALLTDYLKQ